MNEKTKFCLKDKKNGQNRTKKGSKPKKNVIIRSSRYNYQTFRKKISHFFYNHTIEQFFLQIEYLILFPF